MVAADVRVYLTRKRIAPMLSLNLGYVSADGDDWLYPSIGGGVRFGISSKLGISLQLVASGHYDSSLVGIRMGIDFGG